MPEKRIFRVVRSRRTLSLRALQLVQRMGACVALCMLFTACQHVCIRGRRASRRSSNATVSFVL